MRFPEVPPAWRRWRTRIALATLTALVLAFFPYRVFDGGPGAGKGDRLRRELQETRDRSAALAADNARLRREIDALKNDPHAIVDIARDELGLVRPGELVIRIEGPAAATDEAAP